jgi:hypothetical protein
VLGEIRPTVVDCDKYTQLSNTPCGQKAEFLNDTTSGTYIYHWTSKVYARWHMSLKHCSCWYNLHASYSLCLLFVLALFLPWRHELKTLSSLCVCVCVCVREKDCCYMACNCRRQKSPVCLYVLAFDGRSVRPPKKSQHLLVSLLASENLQLHLTSCGLLLGYSSHSLSFGMRATWLYPLPISVNLQVAFLLFRLTVKESHLNVW